MNAATANAAPSLALNDGKRIPQLGFGTWQLSEQEAEAMVAASIGVGFRLIDTAAIYGNETGVGRGVRAAGVPREELFVTTKVWNDRHGYDETLKAAGESLKRLQMDYVDLFLIHWPAPQRGKFVETWRALVELRNRGLARSIGVSNFNAPHLRAIVEATGVTPAVNQIELHPWLPQRELREFHRRNGIVTECWSPLAQGGLLHERRIADLARKLGKTPAQVILAWHLNHGFVPIPKTASKERVRENWAALELHLEPAAIEAIDGLGDSKRMGPDPEEFG